MRWFGHILIVAAMTTSIAETARPQTTRPAATKLSLISVARQRMLKCRLQTISKGTLTASLRHNRKEWENLAPSEREKYRADARAFLNKSRQDQQRLLKHYEQLVRLSPEKQRIYDDRAKWLKVVVESFTPQQRKALLALLPRQRAERLRQRRDELIRQGKLTLEPAPPTTAPADAKPSASRPAE